MSESEALWNAYHRERDLKYEKEELEKKVENLERSLEGHIVLLKKNTFNCHTWELEYVDRYYFGGKERWVDIKYDHELDEPKTGYERLCMEEAGIIKKIDDIEEFHKKMKKSKKEGTISKIELSNNLYLKIDGDPKSLLSLADELSDKGLKVSVKS